MIEDVSALSAPGSLRIAPMVPERASGNAARALASPVGGLTLFRLLAHAEGNVLPVMKLGGAILSDQQLDGRARELMILAAMATVGGRYEWGHHCEIARSLGISEAQTDAIERGDYDASFSARDQALLQFAAALARNPRVADGTFEAVRPFLSEREIVEAILAIGFYIMLAGITEGLGLGAEPPQGIAVMESLRTQDAGKGDRPA